LKKRLVCPKVALRTGSRGKAMKNSTRSGWLGLALCVSGAAVAHHSGAMFDRDKTLTLVGTVKEFKWTNPHAWLEVNIPNSGGGTDMWGVEMNSPNNLVRQGWRSSSLKPGDKVSVTVRPLKNGDKGGAFVSVTLANGQVLGNPTRSAAPAAAPQPGAPATTSSPPSY
jgi:hypothetical protein